MNINKTVNLLYVFSWGFLMLQSVFMTGCGYFKNIGYDASEIVQMQVGSGKGAAIDVYGLYLLGVGGGYYKVEWRGYGPRYVPHCRSGYGTATQDYVQILVLGECHGSNAKKGDLILPCWMASHQFPFRGTGRDVSINELFKSPVGKETMPEMLWRSWDFGFTFVPFNYGIKMDISPGKTLDFIGSVFLLDLEGDNIYRINGKANRDKANPSPCEK